MVTFVDLLIVEERETLRAEVYEDKNACKAVQIWQACIQKIEMHESTNTMDASRNVVQPFCRPS